jgi:hypothetical protein
MGWFLPALAAVGSTLLGNHAQNRANQRAVDSQNRWNERLWHMQNAYNHPTEQMARLQEAGLNPRLIYGTSPSSAVGNADKAHGAERTPKVVDNPLNALMTTQDFKLKSAQVDNTRVNSEVQAQEILLKSAQTALTGAKTSLDKQTKDHADQLFKYSMDAAAENVRKLKLDNIGKELDNSFADKTLASRVEREIFKLAMDKETKTGIELDNSLKTFEKNLNEMGLTKNDNRIWRILSLLFSPDDLKNLNFKF